MIPKESAQPQPQPEPASTPRRQFLRSVVIAGAGITALAAGYLDKKVTDYSVLCVRLVLMRLSRLLPMKVLATQRLQSPQSASSV